MTKTTAGYLTGMLTLTFPGAEPVEIGSVSLSSVDSGPRPQQNYEQEQAWTA